MNTIGNGIGIPFFRRSNGGFDPGARFWLDALAGVITSEFEASADRLFIDLKGGAQANTTNKENVLDEIYLMTPLAPTILADVEVNAVNVGTYDPTVVNSPNLISLGIDSNGTGYINTNFNPISVGVDINSFSYGFTTRTAITGSKNGIGSRNGATQDTSNVNLAGNWLYGVGQAGKSNGGAQALSIGTQIVSRTGSNAIAAYLNGSLFDSDNKVSTSFLNGNMGFIAHNNNGSFAGAYQPQVKFTFFFLAKGLTGNKQRDFKDAIVNYNSTCVIGGRL